MTVIFEASMVVYENLLETYRFLLAYQIIEDTLGS